MTNTAKVLALVGVALLGPATGCNDPLQVKYPDIVTPGQLGTAGALATLRAGVIGDFSIAYTGDHPDGSGGNGEGVAMYGGLLADEWINSETFPTRIETDARTIELTNADVDLWFRLLHQARQSAEVAAARYATVAATDPAYAEMLTLAGLTYIFFAETYCNGVPISRLNPDGTITYGAPLTKTQLLDTAIVRFNAAIAVNDPGMTNFASVGKARALLDLDSWAQAAAVAATVPTSFVYIQEHTENTDRENNGVFNGNSTDGRYAVADLEGVNGFPFRSVADPRTPWVDPGATGFDQSTELWTQLRYGSRHAFITVATGVEARLIQAEAALQAGDTGAAGQFLVQLNDPRVAHAADRGYFDPTGAPPIPAPMTALGTADITSAGGAVNLLFAERARWLWLTAHRLGDLRRLLRLYGKNEFPTGPYFKVNFTNYGTDVNIPVPITEKNNPNFSACLDRNP